MVALFLKAIAVGLSVICLLLSPAAFTGAVFVSFALMAGAGIAATVGHQIFAVIVLLVSSVSVGLSPIQDDIFESLSRTALAAFPLVIGYGGVFFGIWRSRRLVPTASKKSM